MVKPVSKFRLYCIGLLMGIADLIPGVSGGTIAFVCGIYEDLLQSIKSLRIQSWTKIAFPFLLPLGAGIVTSIFVFAKLIYFLLLNYTAPLYGLFFGLIAASAWVCAKEARIRSPSRIVTLIIGAALSCILTVIPTQLVFGAGFFGIFFAGMLGTGAMLLPGISGSFLLQVFGVYPLIIYALADPFNPGSLTFLTILALGISCGFIIFSRVISTLLLHFRQVTLSLLVGFMAGGLKAIWPFQHGELFLPLFMVIVGFFLVICLEIKAKRLNADQGVK